MTPDIDLVVGQNNWPEKTFYADFGGEKCDFFDFFQNIAISMISCRMVNIGVLGAFRSPEGRFPAKDHISRHYITQSTKQGGACVRDIFSKNYFRF